MHKEKFQGLMVTLASVEEIEKWSNGAVENPDTVNYRTGKPKPKGLFCEAIFWPVKNYECACGKYKWIRYKGIVCERCGVEVTTSRVRRERMGHIDLAVPVLHARYKSSPSGWVHQLLWLSSNEIDKILTFVKYAIVDEVTEDTINQIIEKLTEHFDSKIKELDEVYQEEFEAAEKKKQKDAAVKLYNENKLGLEKEFNRVKSIIADLKFWATILESDYRNIFSQFADMVPFASGPDAILKMLKKIDVEKEIEKRVKEFPTIKSEEKRKKAFQLIKLLINLHVSGVKPENMVIKKLPVIPPDVRPVVQLEWGKFASSDVNLFYRRVLMRNIRLKKMIQVGMPDVVKKNEIRLLQESVNNLLVGEKWGPWRAWSGVKVFKSLSDMLSGKEGIFRKNLLGKRVDYSWRSIITVWPDLNLNECGLPLYIAVRMFTPFIIGKLIEKKIVYTPKQAEKLIKDGAPIALKFLEEVVKDKYVLLNRAPTLHRLSIEAFKIKLMPGKTIRIHPLVCPAFNADFDGDQMAVHLPVSDEAQREARELIAADKNILKPASGEPTITHSQDMVLGIYFLTDDYRKDGEKYVGIYWSVDEVVQAYESRRIEVKDTVVIPYDGEHIKTTVWRVLFNSILPEKVRFINKTMRKKDLKKVLSIIFDSYSMEETVRVADMIKNYGFTYATQSATSINVLDMKVPVEKEEIMQWGDKRANEIYNLFFKWFYTEQEKHRLIINVRSEVKTKIEWHVKELSGPGDDMFSMIDSWARGSVTNTVQISGMKWLVVNPKGEVIELPIKGSFVEWLRPVEYFISAHSGRKGKADTALRTAESGYLTRKLCDSSQEVIVREDDCGTTDSITLSKDEAEIRNEEFSEMIYGRTLAQDVHDEKWNTILKKDDVLNKEKVQLIENTDIDMIKVRTPIVCKTVWWVCKKCYGMDLSTREAVEVGVPVGVIAAQSIGEPTTQLTMNTFHLWWVASKEWDMTQSIDRIAQLFEVRKPKNPAVIAPFDGKVTYTEKWRLKYMTITSDYQHKLYGIKDWYKKTVKKWELLKKGAVYATAGRSKLKTMEEGVVLKVVKDHIVLGLQETVTKLLTGISPLPDDGQKVYKWEVLTTWALEVREYMDIVGDLEAQKYIIREVKKVYSGQWQDVNDRHIEIVVRQLFSKVFIEDSGDSSFVPGTYAKYRDFIRVNEELSAAWRKESKGKRLALWLTNIAKATDSWMSAASFQETIRVMVWASLKWAIDDLSDLKSNVIIGRLLPVGDVYRKQYQWEDIEDILDMAE